MTSRVCLHPITYTRSRLSREAAEQDAVQKSRTWQRRAGHNAEKQDMVPHCCGTADFTLDCHQMLPAPCEHGMADVPQAATMARPKQDGQGPLIPRPSLMLHHPLSTHHISTLAHLTIKQPALCQDLHCVSESSHKDIRFLPFSRQILSECCMLHLHMLHAN